MSKFYGFVNLQKGKKESSPILYFDGQIYNRKDLRKTLEKKRFCF